MPLSLQALVKPNLHNQESCRVQTLEKHGVAGTNTSADVRDTAAIPRDRERPA